MVHRKITYYKMLTPERRAEIAATVGARCLRSQARFAVGQSPSSLEPTAAAISARRSDVTIL